MSWTWLSEGEIRGLTVTGDGRCLHWFDQMGCHCTDDDFIEQTVADFHQHGPPALIGPLPEDVAAELAQVLLDLRGFQNLAGLE